MEIALFYSVLNILKDYMADILVVLCVAGLVIFQIRQSKFWFCANRNNENHREYLNANIVKLVKESACINKELSGILYKLGADRAWVYVFHNSGSNLLGQPFAKVTNTNEVVAVGLPSVLPDRKDVPVGLMASYIEKILEDRELCCPYSAGNSPHQTEEDKYIANYLHSMGIKSSYAIAIFSTEHPGSKEYRELDKSHPLGFIGIDYVRKEKELSTAEWNKLHSTAMIIKGFMLSSIMDRCKIKG